MTDEKLREALARFAMNPYWDSSTVSWPIAGNYMWGLEDRQFIELYMDADTTFQYRITPEGFKFLAGD